MEAPLNGKIDGFNKLSVHFCEVLQEKINTGLCHHFYQSALFKTSGGLLDHVISCDQNFKVSCSRGYQQDLKSVFYYQLAKLVTSPIHPSFLNIGLPCPVCFV